MPLFRPLLALLLAVAVQLGAPLTSEAVIVDGVAAKINSEVITYYQVDEALKPYMLQRGMDLGLLEDPAALPELQRRALDSLIEDQLIAQEAKALKTTVADEEIDRSLEFAANQQQMDLEQFKQAITQFGVSWKTYRDITRRNLLRLKIMQIKIGSKVQISPAEVESEYASRYGTDTDKEVYIDVSHILIQPKDDTPAAQQEALERAQIARNRVQNGEAFGEVAEAASDGPSAPNQGRIGEFKRGELDPQFEAYAFAMEPGEISDVVKTKYGYHVILVTARKEQENPDVDDRKNAIMGEMRQEEMMRQYQGYIKGLRSRAFVDVEL